MIKKYISYLLFACLGLTLGSCERDPLEGGTSFDTTSPERNAFDQWLLKNYVYSVQR